jgi:hypothetical protein
MDTETFISTLEEFSSRYKEWWIKPFEKFREDYSKQNPNFQRERNGLQNYFAAVEEFERNLRLKNDLISEIYDFIDQNYEVYLNTTPNERAGIRNLAEKLWEPNHCFGDFLRKYVRERVIKEIRLTRKRIWLLRGLVAMSIENSSIDYRDTLTSLAELYIVAEENGIKPKIDFEAIAKISSNDIPRGGSTSMSNLMSGIYSSAILQEQRLLRKISK